MTKEYGRTVVDVQSLEDFRTALGNHHSATAAMLKTIEDKLVGTTGGASSSHDNHLFGVFPDGQDINDYYVRMALLYHARVQRLKTAVEAAQKATNSILHTYRTVEARNDANSKDIARTMRPVDTALKGA